MGEGRAGGTGSGGRGRGPGREPRSPHRAMTDGELIVAMRRREGAAFAEFFLRFRPLLLDRARRLGIDRSEREERVQDFLTDVALALAELNSVLPRALRTYL